MKRMELIGWISWILVVISGLNWGIYGLFKLDVVAMIFGGSPLLTRLIYILVGLGAAYLIYMKVKKE